MPELLISEGGAEILLSESGLDELISESSIPLFPSLPGRSYPSGRPNLWNTIRQEAVSGQVTAIGLWSAPKRRYEMSFSVLRTLAYQELQILEDFIDSLNGGVFNFYLDDVDDNTAVLQPFGTGTGSLNVFQLQRAQVTGGFSAPIQSPRLDTVSVYVDGVLAAPSSYTISPVGVVTFVSSPSLGAKLTWSGNYYWLCKLDSDSTDFVKNMYWIWELKKITATTVPL